MASYVYVLSKYWRVFMRWLRSTPLILVVMSGIMLLFFCSANFLDLSLRFVNPEPDILIICGPYLLFGATILVAIWWALSPGNLAIRTAIFSLLFSGGTRAVYICYKIWSWFAPSNHLFEMPCSPGSKSFSVLFALALAVFTACQSVRTLAGFRLQHARNIQRIKIKPQTSIAELRLLTFIVAAGLQLTLLSDSPEWMFAIIHYFVVNLLFVFVYLLPIAYYLLRDIDYPFTYSLLITFCSLYLVPVIYILLLQLALKLFQLPDSSALGLDFAAFSTALGFTSVVIPLALLRRDHFELRTWRDD
jgi:hypothetical protein